jgi:hypothetical protein
LRGDHFVLISENCGKDIVKVYRYRATLSAPISQDSPVGWVFYKTDIFQNCIIKTIKSSDTIGKSGRFDAICDSFSYIIFGRPSKTKYLLKK